MAVKIGFSDIHGPVNAATDPEKASLVTALGIAAAQTDARLLADGDYGIVSVSGGVWAFDAASLETSLQSRTAAEQRADGIARQRLVRADSVTFVEGDIAVATGDEGEFEPQTPIPDTPATAIDIAAKTDQVAGINALNLGIWQKRTTLAMAATPTIDWSGAETTPGTLDGHSRNILLLADDDASIQVGAIAPGQEGESFLIVVENSGGGTFDIDVQDHSAGGARVLLADGLTMPALGANNGDLLVIRGFIQTTGTGGGLWVIRDAVAITVPGFSPSWVDNTGTGYLTYDGPGIGADTPYFDMVFLVRSLNTNPSATCRIFQNRGPKIDVRFNGTGTLQFFLTDTASTVICNWASTSAQDGAGEWLFHIAADLTGTPVVTISKCELTAGVPGSWSAIPGSFSVGPIAGTIDNLIGGGGNEASILASATATSICDCELAYFWWSQSVPLPDSAFADAGVLKDPAGVGSPVILVTGPVAALSDDIGSANLTFVVNGTWTDS